MQERWAYTIRTFPVHDTEIGVEAGYESDQALREAVAAERAKLPADVRGAVEEADKAMQRAFLGIPLSS